MNIIDIKSVGSCATREISPYLKTTKLVGNVGFTSIFSILGESIPLVVTKDLIINKDNPPSEWEIKMMNMDLQKGAEDYIRRDPGKYVIIDLIDERYDFLQYGDSLVLFTNVLKKVNLTSLPFERVSHQDFSADFVDRSIRAYCDMLRSYYEPNKIILNKALMVTKFVDWDGSVRQFDDLAYIEEYNRRCGFYYDKIHEYIPESKVIEMPENTLADVSQRWGLQPYHYTESAYKQLALEVDRYVQATERAELAEQKRAADTDVVETEETKHEETSLIQQPESKSKKGMGTRMGLVKKHIREMVINAVQFAVREEMQKQTNTAAAATNSAADYDDIDGALSLFEDRIVSRLDKQIERWTWDRYQRMEQKDIPNVMHQLDLDSWNMNRKLETWTWDRYNRTRKDIESWTWDRYNRTKKDIESWTWDRCNRTKKDIESWTWERYNRTKKDIEGLQEKLDFVRQDVLEDLFLKMKVPYHKDEKIKAVMLFQIPSCWPSNESVWEAMQADDRFELAMLLYDREQKEPVQMAGARAFLEDCGIPYIEAEKYDFAKERPHIIIYQTPWDDQHRPDFLKSDAMKRLGIRVVYLPYGIEYSAAVRLSWIFSIMQFRAKPWLSFSLSDGVKLEHRLQSKYGADFLEVTGYPKFDSLYHKERFPLDEELKQIIGDRKVVFWQTHFPAFNGDVLYPEPDLSEYIAFAEKASQYPDLFFLFRPHPKFYEQYETIGRKEEADAMREIVASATNFYEYDDPDYRPALIAADAVIGDRSALMIEAVVLDVPVQYMTNFFHKEKMLSAVEPIFESYYQGSDCYDMIRFLDLVVCGGNDYKKQERRDARALCVPFFDGKCGDRIVDTIAEKIAEEG